MENLTQEKVGKDVIQQAQHIYIVKENYCANKRTVRGMENAPSNN